MKIEIDNPEVFDRTENPQDIVSGITRLKNVLSELCNDRMTVKQREQQLSIVDQLLTKFKKYLLEEVYSHVLSLSDLAYYIYEDALKEANTNHTKSGQKSFSPKHASFNNFIKLATELADDSRYDVVQNNTIDFSSMLLKLLSNAYISEQSWMESALASILSKFVSNSDFALEADLPKKLWDRVIPYIRRIPRSDSQIYYIQIALSILRSARETPLHLYGKTLVLQLLDSVVSSGTRPKNVSKSHLQSVLELFVFCLDVWGIECRDLILATTIPYAEFLSDSLTMESNAENEVAWRFLDMFCQLAMPDCNSSALTFEPVYSVASQILRCSVKSLLSLSVNRANFIVADDKLGLVARAIVICELCPDGDRVCLDYSVANRSAVFSQSTPAKKRKETTIFESLINWDFDYSGRSLKPVQRPNLVCSCLIILNSVIRSWSHRLGRNRLEQIAQDVWKQNVNISDAQRSYFCNIICTLVQEGVLGTDSVHVKSEATLMCDSMQDPRVRIQAIWKYAVVSSHVEDALDCSMRLMITILRRFKEIIGTDTSIVESLLATAAHSRGASSLSTILFMLQNLEFDERISFPGVDEKSSGIAQWRLRCQLADWFIENSKEDISQLLYQLCLYHPIEVKNKALENEEMYTLNHSLKLLGLIEKPLVSDAPPSSHINFSLVYTDILISEVVDYILLRVHDTWFRRGDNRERVRLCNVILRFCYYLSSNTKRAPSLNSLHSVLASCSEWIISVCSLEPGERLPLLKALDPTPSGYGREVTVAAREALMTRSSECPVLFARFGTCGFPIATQCFLAYMDEVARLLRCGTANPALLNEAASQLECFLPAIHFCPDVILLMQKCGDVLEPTAISLMIQRAKQIVEEETESGHHEEEDIQLKTRWISELELRMKPHIIHTGKLPPEIVNAVTSPTAIQHLDAIQLNPTVVSSMYNHSENNNILLQCLIRHVFSSPHLWTVSHKLIAQIVGDQKLYEVCADFVPQMNEYLEFYSLSLVVNKVSCKMSDIHRRLLTLQDSSLVKKLAQEGHTFSAEDFPAAFTLDVIHWPTVSESFWTLYSDRADHLLASLFSVAASHMRLGLEHRLIPILYKLITDSPEMAEKMKKPFVVVIRTIMMHILSSVVERNSRDYCIEEMFDSCCAACRELNDGGISMAYLVDIWCPLLEPVEVTAAKEMLKEIVKKEAISLVKNGRTETADVFMLKTFWDYLLSKITVRPQYVDEIRRKENYMFDQFLLAWEVIPHVRPVLAKLILFFNKECELKPMFRAPKASKAYLSCLADYCQLQLASYRELLSYDVSLCCLRVLSSNVFEDQSILQWKEIFSTSLPRSEIQSTDLSVGLCEMLLKVVSDHVRGKPQWQPLSAIKEMLREMPILCHLLAPCLCANSAALKCAKAILEFGIEHFDHIDATDRSLDRFARTICECIDGVGLGIWSTVKCSPTELFVIARLIENAGYHQHAYAVVNLAFDRLVAERRNRIGCGGKIPENRQLTELLQDIYVNTNDFNASKSLPGWAQVSPKVQHIKAVAENNWIRLSSDSLSTPEQVAMARFFSGDTSESSDHDTRYLFAMVSLDWLQTNVSYPKKLTGKWSRLYAAIHQAVSTRDPQIFSAMISNLTQKISILDTADLASHGISLIVEIRELEFLYRFIMGYINQTHMDKCKPVNLLMASAYCYREWLTSTQLTVFSPQSESLTDSQIGQMAESTSFLIQICNEKLMAVKAFPACLKLVAMWQSVVQTNSTTHKRFSDILQIEKCRIMIATGDYQMAHYHLTTITGQNLQYDIALDAICLLGRIHVDDMQQLDAAIKLMSELVENLSEELPVSLAAKAIEQLHTLGLRQLTELESYMTTPSFTTRVEAVEHWSALKPLEKIRKSSDISSDERRRLTIVSRELECEQREIKKVRNHLDTTVDLIVKSGLRLLKFVGPVDSSSPPSDLEKSKCIRILFPLLDIVFRYERNQSVVDELRKYVLDFTPSIWIPVLSHIVSHCFTESPISFVIRDLVTRLIVAYPFHVLPVLLGYKFDGTQLHKKLAHYKMKADQFRHGKSVIDPGALNFDDKEFLIASTMGPRIDSLIANAERKVPQAARLSFKNIVNCLTAAQNMYRQFVWLRTDAVQYFTKTKEGYIMSAENILIVKNIYQLKKIPLPVIDQKLGIAGDYKGMNLIRWAEIDPVCQKADGQSAPKVIRVKGSDGLWYKTVWKYGEDLRQDSLVQQLFVVMSDLLNSRQPLRTYNVMPLDGYSGVIEFCENTSALKNILVGSDMQSGLHHEIHPTEDVNGVRAEVNNLQRTGAMTDDIFQQEILDRITPVFRHFFYRKFPTVGEWIERIDAYVLSLAEWSIVCYVVGLGDRHTSNVLFDEENCNFVHIDLGMILEYGKRILPVPERVPFRLTRDLLDPILIQGINGTLNFHCSAALSNLRNNKLVIMGMASVFLRETMANFRDSSDVTQPSHVAATAISRLRDKLNGTDATIASVNPKLQAQRLLAEATNTENLAALFSGWASFL